MKLEIEGLSKTYPGGIRALDGVTLSMDRGIFGLLGDNGAGKSTLMRILATLLAADTGTARLGSIDLLKEPDRARRALGYLPQEFGVYPRASAKAMLEHLAMLKGVSPTSSRREMVESLLHQVNLYDVRSRRLDSFSGGMKRRFGIAQALLGQPALVIVDEPTAGLDPGERNRFYNLLSEVSEKAIVILATHIVEDIKSLCERLAIIGSGKVVFSGTPEDLIRMHTGKIWQKVVRREEERELRERLTVVSTSLVRGKIHLQAYCDESPGEGFEPKSVMLEDAYFASTRAEVGPSSPH